MCNVIQFGEVNMEHLSCEELLDLLNGILAVHRSNMEGFRYVPDGEFPICKNKLGTYECERCGRDVRGARGACPAVPPEERWTVDSCGEK